MPRVSKNRTLANERNLAARISAERDKRDWSYEGTAHRMGAAGYPIQASAIFKIEKGDPPRRITVDELVGFAAIFETTVDDLLAPPELVDQQRARELIGKIDEAISQLGGTTEFMTNMYIEYLELAAVNPPLYEHVTAGWFGEDDDGRGERDTPVGEFVNDHGEVIAPEATAKLANVAQQYVRGIIDVAGDVVEAGLKADAARKQRQRKPRGTPNGKR